MNHPPGMRIPASRRGTVALTERTKRRATRAPRPIDITEQRRRHDMTDIPPNESGAVDDLVVEFPTILSSFTR